jgi:hypothetical protein
LFLEETASSCVVAGERLLVLGCVGEKTGLLTLGCLLNFGSIVDAELTRLRLIKTRIPVTMIHVSAEVLKRGLNACFGYFELAIVTECGLSLNLDLWSIAHLD